MSFEEEFQVYIQMYKPWIKLSTLKIIGFVPALILLIAGIVFNLIL